MKSKSNKINELTTKSVADLNVTLREKLLEHFNLRMQKGSGQEVQPNTIKKVRREIAQVKTIIHQKRGETV